MSVDDLGAADGAVGSFAAGSRIAGYRLEERIGQGGMAVVFRARDEQLDRLVALKILTPALAGDAEFRRRFTSESRAAAAIDDPHIVPVFAAGEAAGVLFIAMRYVAGGDAQSLLKREGPLPPGRVTDIISAMAAALDAAHHAGLVHRDVKPSNMLIDVRPGRPDRFYLSDFGLTKAVASTSGLTIAGVVLGTLAYMSPEQISGKPVDGRADQYALACSAFELLAGGPPFPRDEPTAMMYAHLLEPPPPLTSRRSGLPWVVDAVLSRAMAKAPGDRYASCGEFADALRGAFGFHPYRRDAAVIPEATNPPIGTAWPAAPVASRPSEAATGPGPFSWATGASATETRIPAVSDPVTGPGQPPERGGGQPPEHGGGQPQPQPQPRRRLRRRVAVAALIIAPVAALIAGLLSAGGGGPAKTTTVPLAVKTVPIAVKSAQAAVNGDVYVVYYGGQEGSGEVYGQIRQAASGEVARLYAQQFPYKTAPTRVGAVTLHPAGATASYEFQVTPTLATRYRVELFKSSTASTPIAASGVATIYVVFYRSAEKSQACSRPVCYESLKVIDLVPPSALQAEMSKSVYLYFGLNLAPQIEPASPQSLQLGAGNGHVTAPHRISADEYSYTVTLSFQIGNDAYHWAWRVCTMATEAADGIGLPGHHGCGDQRIPATGYLW